MRMGPDVIRADLSTTSDEATRWRWGVQGAEMVQFRWRGVGGVENGVCGAGNAPGSVQVGQQAGHFSAFGN